MRRQQLSIPSSRTVLLRIGIHPASLAWITTGEATCGDCIFFSKRYVRDGFPVCGHPSNIPADPRCNPWWPTCALYQNIP